MSEKSQNTLPAENIPAGNGTVSKPAAAGPAVAAGSQSSAAVGQPVAPVSKPPALFGGHKGGGKKRADGLIAGSPEAIAADKAKDAERKRLDRAAKKAAALPPPLPSATGAALNAPVAAPVDNAAVPPVAAGAPDGVPLGLVPTFVAWTGTMLARPVKLLTKIVDRFRVSKLMERVRQLGFDKSTEKEIEQRMQYKQTQVEDFNSALTNCLVIELNKRRVPGAEHSHWLELAMASGELVNCHLDTVDFLERKLLEKAERENKAATN